MAKSGFVGKKPTSFIASVKTEVGNRGQRMAMDIMQGVITMSPVMDGTYRGNHNLTVNSENNSYDLNMQDKSGAVTMAKANQEVLKFGFGDYACIQNSLPYALPIENGHSREQAPKGVYRVTFQAVSSKYK